jgi:NAD(P)H-dependent flavin oxidoreductase YrpB (nitropropane dioxygenase family)
MIDEKVPLFVCAVGIPPQWVVDKLHAQGTLVMNMAGHPKHVKKALSVGVDIICATGGEGGAHSGDISTLVLLPQCADLCKGKAILVGGGGVYDGRGIAACMSLGAAGVWVGTRFLASPEANSTKGNLDAILKATSADTRRIEIYSGRPLRVIKNAMNDYWENNVVERKALLAKGVVPVYKLVNDGEWAPGKPLPRRAFFGPPPIDGHWNDVRNKYDDWDSDFDLTQAGQCVGAIDHVAPAADIVQEMMLSLVETLQGHAELVSQASKL